MRFYFVYKLSVGVTNDYNLYTVINLNYHTAFYFDAFLKSKCKAQLLVVIDN